MERTFKPGRYRHWKGKEYQALGLALHSETLATFVVYEPLYEPSLSKYWVRPLELFMEDTTDEEGKTVPRFPLFLSKPVFPCMTAKGNLIYLASPYSSPDRAMQEYRFTAVAIAAGWVINQFPDSSFFSPITHTHPIASHCKLPGHWQYWAAYDQCMLSRCNEMMVLCIPGWRESSGVTAELKIAAELKMPTRYLVPTADGFTVQDTAPDA